MSAQRARSSVTAANRSAHPNLAGVPWWAAVLIAVIATTIGFVFEAGSGSKDLGGVFSAMYALGCVVAVLAVRQSGLFTAIIQPPLILFVAVPGAYFLFHGAEFTGVKDTLINCGYPLVERFPLMLFTTAGVLLIGLVRWYFAMSARTVTAPTADDDAAAGPSLLAGLAAKVTAAFNRGEPADVDLDEAKPQRKHSIDRPATAEKRPRSGRPAKRPAPTRSRHARPPLEDITEAPVDRPRRQPPRRRPDADLPGRDDAEPRRRPRQPRDPGSRTPPPSRREPREPRESRERRDPYGPRPRNGSRFEPYPPYEPYPSYEPPPRRRPSSPAPNEDSSHHPVSRVRYRGDGPGREDQPSWRYDR
ncbi:DUF6542 domain-containing protein [Mycolicibacterium sp. CBM1]